MCSADWRIFMKIGMNTAPLEDTRLFLDISSTSIDTYVPSLYQCVETRSIEVFWLLSQPLPHPRFNLFVTRESFAALL
jgi:hypothetical protein